MTNILNASASTMEVIVQSTLTNVATTVYTVPASSAVKLSSATLTNTGAATSLIYLYVNGTATANMVISNYTIEPYDTVSLTDILGGMTLDEGDTIAGYSSATGVVNLVISAVVLSV